MSSLPLPSIEIHLNIQRASQISIFNLISVQSTKLLKISDFHDGVLLFKHLNNKGETQ